MKRHIWLSLGVGLSAALIGCDDEKKGGGGANNDADAGDVVVDYEDRFNDIEDRLDGVGGDIDKLDGRLDDLENPKVGSCSEGELCIPDGLDIVGSRFEGIVRALCKHEVDCCDAGELRYKFGAAIKNVDDCVATFNDFLKRGYSPGFLNHYQVSQIVEVAHALNDTNVHVALDANALKACADSIASVACTSEPAEGNLRCDPKVVIDEDDACAAHKLLKGQEREGDLCNPTGVINECGEGLVCVLAKDGDGCWDEGGGYVYGDNCEQRGVCVKQAAVGDRCFEDWDCGKLFCNHETGKCQARAKVGEPCEYVDPTFEYLSPFYFWPYGNGDNTNIDCEEGAICDPTTKKCVGWCSQGAFCYYHHECPAGLVCSFTATAEWGNARGQCLPPKKTGEACTSMYVGTSVGEHENGYQNDCESKVCSGGQCQAPLKAAGAACTTAGYDATCQSGYCNTDLKCAATCDVACEGDDCPTCPNGTYCDTGEVIVASTRVCKPLIAKGTACDQSTDNRHLSCATGFCDLGNTATCQDKVAQNAACPSGYHEQCQDGQFCNDNGTCATPKAVGTQCAAGTDECGPFAYCIDTKGQSAPGDYRCFTVDGDLPNGAPCEWNGNCASGWCRPSTPNGAGTWACAPRIEAGQPCDVEDGTRDTCVEGHYCAFGPESSEGTCEPRLTVGQPCDPFYEGSDCWGGDCVLRRGAWICNNYALPPDTVMCDGK